MLFKRTLAAGAFVLAAATAASAADLGPIVVSAPPPPPPPTFSWDGPYVGAYAGYLIGPGVVQIGAQAGYNFVSGGFLAGIELQAGALISGGVAFEGNANARLGAILGGNFLLYAEAGLGVILPGGVTWTAGGGGEVAVGSNVSLFAEVKALGVFGGGCCIVTVQGGVNWHPAY